MNKYKLPDKNYNKNKNLKLIKGRRSTLTRIFHAG